MSTYKGFSTTEVKKPQRSLFDLSHEKRLSGRMGKLIPIFICETLPKDHFSSTNEIMLRLAPLIAPIMHRVNVTVHNFFIPNRLLWLEWETFITNGRLGTETPPVPPCMDINDILSGAGGGGEGLLDLGTLADYLGVGRIEDSQHPFSAATIDLMPFIAYYKVWYDYYRDRNFIDDDVVSLPMASGQHAYDVNTSPVLKIKNRDWQADYFTTAMLTTQRGNEVLMPLQGSGSVTYLKPSLVRDADTDALETSATGFTTAPITGALRTDGGSGGANNPVFVQNIATVDFDGSDVSINDLRTAMALQRWMERNMLSGSRYTEMLWNHFNQKSSDGRLQRAEYLGGGRIVVKINEVVTTAFSEDSTAEVIPPGNMAGHGFVLENASHFNYTCEEHGFILSIMSVMPTSAYMQGSSRMFFSRNTFLDYPWPTFAHLGEQEVKKYELFTNNANITVDRTAQPLFGYQSRYADWKYIPSSSHGDFKDSLDFWHMTRKFLTTPVLGETFNNFEDNLQNRVFAVSEVDTLWCYIYNKITVVRSLPYFGTPQLIG